jgi:gliding motility-associated-like protein
MVSQISVTTSPVSGEASPTCMSTGIVYSVTPTAGSGYSWEVPADAVITSGASGPDNNQIMVDFGIQSGSIIVTETNSFGCQGDPVQLSIQLQGCDLTVDFSASKTNLCLGEEVTFTDHTQGLSMGATYQWDFGDGADPSSATLSGPHVVTYATPGLKTVRLIITDIITDTLLLTDYITVNPAPVAVLETAELCGPGDVEIVATLTYADRVEFSIDEGLTIAGSDDSAPYAYNLTLGESETVQVWGRAYHSTNGCYGTWENYAFAISQQLPATEKIASSHPSASVPGYVDIVCSGQQNVLYYVSGEAGATYNWHIWGNQVLDISADNVTEVEIDWDVPAGDYFIELQKTSAAGCTGNVRDTMVLVSQPQPDLGGDVTLCDGNSFTFSLDEEYASYEWSDFSSDPTLTVTVSGEVYVTVWDEYGCSGSDTAMLLISSRPVVNLGNDTVICGDNPLELDAGDFVSYQWSTGETTNPIEVREGAGTVSVTVTNDEGCEGSDEIVINPCDPENLLGVIPNTFTPNDDQVHDSWEIKNLILFPDASIQVFDRWGRIVFKSDGGYDNDWKGTGSNGKDLPVDTYYYIIDLKIEDAEPITGDVTIIR